MVTQEKTNTAKRQQSAIEALTGKPSLNEKQFALEKKPQTTIVRKVDAALSAPAKTADSRQQTAAKEEKEESGNGNLKVLFCVSEAQPYASSGGLGEVGGSLPKALQASASNVDVRVVTPLYGHVCSDVRKRFKFLGHFMMQFAWREEYCGVFELKCENITTYFIDNEKYFKRDNLYGYEDDGERFAFFSKACIDSMKLTGFKPDIIHAHDWQSALTVVYLKTLYKDNKDYTKVKTIFTLHNINYQGKFPYEFINNILTLDYKYKNLLEYAGQVNLVKAAIECCDLVNTVSPTYAEEIKTSEFAIGLETCIYENAQKLTGIMNGIDYKFYDPKKDKELFENYDVKTLEKKAANKRGIQKLFQMQIDDSIPMLVYNGRLTEQKGIDLIKDGIDEILGNRIQMIVMGNGEKRYENFFEYIENKYQGKFKQLRYSNNLAKKLYASADLMIMPSLFEPCGLSQMIASRYGTVPIVRETGGLKDTVRDFGCEGGGNGYTFKNYSVHDMLYSIKRGVTDFVNDGPDWIHKMKTVITRDFSWKNTVKDYIALYKKVKKLKG